MGLFQNIGSLEKEGPGRPEPERGVARYVFLLWNNIGKLIGANFLFILFSLPVATIPAAITGLSRVCIQLVREGTVHVWEEFWKEFKRCFWKSIFIALCTISLLLWCTFFLRFGLIEGGVLCVIFFIAAIILGMLTLLWSAYAFVLLSLLDLPFKGIIRNAFQLVFLGIPHSLGVLGTEIVVVLFTVGLFPLSAAALLLFGFVWTQFTICFFINAPVQKWIVDPYEERFSQKTAESES